VFDRDFATSGGQSFHLARNPTFGHSVYTANNGSGIASEAAAYVLDRLYHNGQARSREAGDGHSIAKRIAECPLAASNSIANRQPVAHSSSRCRND